MFKISQTDGTLGGFFNLFGVHTFAEKGIAFYRPVFREVLHNIYFNIFGLNHLPFRILLLGIHFINISLVYLFMQSIFKRKSLSFLTALFFGISSANTSLLYYLAGGIETSGATMFALLTVIFYKKYIDSLKFKFQIISLVIFLLALSSHEIILSIPFILFGLILLSAPTKKSLSQILILWPFFLLSAIILYVDIFKIGLSPGEHQYQIILNAKTLLQSFVWYSFWSFGTPEMLSDFVLPGFKLNPDLMHYWGDSYAIIFSTFALSISILFFFILNILLKIKTIFLNKKFLFLLYWFPVGILPVIFLPAHKSSHYLVFVLPSFWAAIWYIALNFYSNFKKSNKKLAKSLLTIFITSTLLLNFASIKLGEKTYWAANRGRIAEILINQLKSTYPSLPKGASIYFKNDPSYPYLTKEWGNSSKQASIILNGSDAIQLLYQDYTIKVYYEDLEKPDFSENNVYSLVAKIY